MACVRQQAGVGPGMPKLSRLGCVGAIQAERARKIDLNGKGAGCDRNASNQEGKPDRTGARPRSGDTTVVCQCG